MISFFTAKIRQIWNFDNPCLLNCGCIPYLLLFFVLVVEIDVCLLQEQYVLFVFVVIYTLCRILSTRALIAQKFLSV